MPATDPDRDSPTASERPPDATREDGRRVRDRHVLLIGAAVVLGVLGVRALGLIFPAVPTLFAGAPLVIVVLILVTVVVLVRSLLRPRAR